MLYIGTRRAEADVPVRLQARPIRIHDNGEPEGVGHYWNHRPYRVPDAAYLVSARRGPGGLRAPILPEGSAHQMGRAAKQHASRAVRGAREVGWSILGMRLLIYGSRYFKVVMDFLKGVEVV